MVRLYCRLMILVSSIGLTCTDVNDGGFNLRIYGSRFLLIKVLNSWYSILFFLFYVSDLQGLFTLKFAPSLFEFLGKS